MQECTICDKGYKKGFTRSHSNRATIKKSQVNLQWTKLGNRRVKACTQCIKSASRSKQPQTVST